MAEESEPMWEIKPIPNTQICFVKAENSEGVPYLCQVLPVFDKVYDNGNVS